MEAISEFDPHELVFLDEMGVSRTLSVLYGWGDRKETLVELVPCNRGKNLSVVGAFDSLGMICTRSQLGAMTRENFEFYLEWDLLPVLTRGSVLILDNASIHHGGRIATLVEAAGCHLLYLPPYSPDFNPIELAWGYIKRLIRRACPRCDTSRLSALSDALATIPESLASACFRHCGYLQSN